MPIFLRQVTLLCFCLLSGAAMADLEPGKTTVFITGANRGIGLEFVRQMSARGWNIIATTRKPDESEALRELAAVNEQIVIEQLDVTDHARIDELAEKYKDQPIDILLSNAGLTPNADTTVFKRLNGLDFDMLLASMEVNAIAPLKLAQAFMDNVAMSEQKKIIVMTSFGGSFELSPKAPMMYGYRASKAALNMYMYTLSFETPKKGVILTLISPGPVNTSTTPGMTQPNGQEPEESIAKMLVVIDALTPENNGQFLAHENGELLAW